LETGFESKKRMTKFFVIIGIIFAIVIMLWGVHNFKHKEIRVVKKKYENGLDKEVWVYKKCVFGKGEKIKEITYFRNGNKQSEVDIKRGKVNGRARLWYENGNLHMEATYKNNKVNGVRTAYHENGRIFCRAEYENGKLLRKKNWDKKGEKIYLPVDRE
jgi:hypothetical protein